MRRRSTIVIRTVTTVCVLLLCCAFCACYAASPTLGIEAGADPSSFTVPGSTTLRFTLTNDSRKTIENICLVTIDGRIVETADPLARGKSLVIEHMHTLTQEELNAGYISYNISCTYEGVQYTYPATVPVSIAASGPNIEIRRQISSEYAVEGQEITIVYQLRNTGGTDAVGIMLRDRLGDFLVNIDRLSPNSTYTACQHIAITENTSSRTTVTWQDTASKPEVFTAELDQVDIRLVETTLTATLTASRSMEDSTLSDVVLTLSNSGSMDYTGLAITDALLEIEIADNVTVPAASSIQIEKTYHLHGDSDYCWRVSGFTPTRQPFWLVTDTATIYQPTDNSIPELTVSAVTASDRISRKGYVEVTVSVLNSGSAMAKHVQISEERDGNVFTFAAVPTGDPITHTFLTEISEERVLRYNATYTTADNERVTVYADPITVTIGRGGTLPQQITTPESLISGITDRFQASPLLLIVLIIAVVVLVVLSLVLIISSRRRRFHRRVRREATRQLRESAARTGKIKPIDARSDKSARPVEPK